MRWSTLGTVTLGYEWRLLDAVAIGTQTFRITQSWTKKPARGYGLISQLYVLPEGSVEYFGTKRLYPSTETRIVDLLIPHDYYDAGIVLRYIAVRFTSNTLAQVPDLNWKVTVDEFYGE